MQLTLAQINTLIICATNIMHQYSEMIDWSLPHTVSRNHDSSLGDEVALAQK